ncbi:MAG: transposase [Candidatus Hodarchaeota archaeon]
MASSRFLWIPFQSYRKVDGKVCLCEIFQKAGTWFAAIVVDRPEPSIKPNGRILAIDLGVYNVAACVDETGQGVVYSGKGLLTIQHYFNKQIAKVQQRLNTRQKRISAGLRALYWKRGMQISQNVDKITTHLIAVAVGQGITTLVVGDFTHIRNQMHFGAKTNQKLHAWSFKQIITQFTYK